MKQLNQTKKALKVFLLMIMASFCLTFFAELLPAFAADDSEVRPGDYERYLKYNKYLKWYKRKKYLSYKWAKNNYGFSSYEQKENVENCYDVIKEMKDSGVPRTVYKSKNCWKKFKHYQGYLIYLVPRKKYAVYQKYNKKKYKKPTWKKYNTDANKAAFERWIAAHPEGANLSGDATGPAISVGIHAITEDQLEDDSFRITAYKASTDEPIPYIIRNKESETILNVAAGRQTRVKYVGNETYRIYNYNGDAERNAMRMITFRAKNSSDVNDIYFKVEHSSFSSAYDEYRDIVRLDHYDPPGGTNDRIWVINFLPLEHYVWGMGEITATGHMDYNRTMTISYRTYGYWKIKHSTAYAAQGFKVDATSGNQIYKGYKYETTVTDSIRGDRIKQAARDTRGKIVMYGQDIAITPYSSWTDGRTRSFEERWGSDNYPWCQSVDDPWGKHPWMSTSELVSAGNHMVGLSAHGALDRAGEGWDYGRIIRYYFTDISIYRAY